MSKKQYVAIDCEWNRNGYLLCLAYCYADGDTHILTTHSEIKNFCKKHSSFIWVGHNIKSDLLVIYENIDYLHYKCFDTMIAGQILSNGKVKKSAKGFHSYGNYVKLFCNVELDKSHQISFLKLDSSDEFTDEQVDYIKNDVKYLHQIKDILLTGLIKSKAIKAMEIDMNAVAPLVDIEKEGMYINTTKYRKYISQWENKKDDLTKKMYDLLEGKNYPITTTKEIKLKNSFKYVTKPINFGSGHQLKVIYADFGVDLPINKDGKKSVNTTLLKQFNDTNPDNPMYDFTVILLDYKIYSKLLSTFGKKLIDNLKNGETLHTVYTIANTTTGRLSSKGDKQRPYTTNVQNIPAKREEGKQIMSCIAARKGYKIVASDMAGAELRLATSFSKDQLLLDNFNKGADFHSELACCSWKAICEDKGVPYKPVTSKQPLWNNVPFRTVHKGVNFGILYGASPARVAEVLGIDIKVAKKAFKDICATVPILMGYLKSNQEKAKKNGFLQAKYSGRIRFGLSPTEAANWEIQEANATAMKIALFKIHQHIKKNKLDIKIINTVHDSIVLSVNERHIVLEEHLFIQEIMAESLGMLLDGVKGESDITVNNYWSK